MRTDRVEPAAYPASLPFAARNSLGSIAKTWRAHGPFSCCQLALSQPQLPPCAHEPGCIQALAVRPHFRDVPTVRG